MRFKEWFMNTPWMVVTEFQGRIHSVQDVAGLIPLLCPAQIPSASKDGPHIAHHHRFGRPVRLCVCGQRFVAASSHWL